MSETLRAILDNPALSRPLVRVKAVREAAALLRESRGRSGLTQEQLAEKLNVTQSFVSQLESGKMESAPALATLADALALCGETLRLTTVREVEGLQARIKVLEGEAERMRQPMASANQPTLSRTFQRAARAAAIKPTTPAAAKPEPTITVTHDGDRIVLRLDVAEEFLPDLQPLKASPMAVDLLSAQQVKNVSDLLGNTAVDLGFIAPIGGGSDVFVHVSATERAGMRTLVEGQKVSYEVVMERGKPADASVRPPSRKGEA